MKAGGGAARRGSAGNLSTYETAEAALAEALVAVWRACDGGSGNLPECLSYALGRAVKVLGFDLDWDGDPLRHEDSCSVAGGPASCATGQDRGKLVA